MRELVRQLIAGFTVSFHVQANSLGGVEFIAIRDYDYRMFTLMTETKKSRCRIVITWR